MNPSEQQRIAKLLKQSLPPVTNQDAHLDRDLWPAMLQRLQQPAPWYQRAGFDRAWFNPAWFNQVWFDCTLGAAVVTCCAFFPSAIPVLLYHL
jgi:hypothetical protein